MIQLTSTEISALAARIRTQAATLSQTVSLAGSQMHAMESEWNSPASRAFLSEFDSIAPVSRSYVQTIENFALFLEQTAQAYEANEQALSVR